MEVLTSVEGVRVVVGAAHARGERVGFVPTMGALHSGHLSLVEAAKGECGFVVVSIFVNPTQFGPGEDFDAYPRPIEDDLWICEQAGVDAVFAPTAGEMYPEEQVTWVTVDKLTDRLCGAGRPGHFRGVTTVCTKLFNIVGPDLAFFGQKDGQQAAVIRRMVRDLNMELEICVCPTVREADGLAVSSRNRYLSDKERADAVLLYEALKRCEELATEGVRDAVELTAAMREVLGRSDLVKPEYVCIVDAETLEEVERVEGPVMVAIAARVGSARLIDNVELKV